MSSASIQQCMYKTRVHNIDELRQVCCVWYSLEQSLIDNAVDQWPVRKGQHAYVLVFVPMAVIFEHTL